MSVGNKPAGLPLSLIPIKAKEGFMGEQDLYIVRSSRAGWAVSLDGKTLRVFDERPKAIEAAVVMAEASARHGRISGIAVEEEDGDRIPIWDAGWDLYSTLS
jgi:hypothetical protein